MPCVYSLICAVTFTLSVSAQPTFNHEAKQGELCYLDSIISDPLFSGRVFLNYPYDLIGTPFSSDSIESFNVLTRNGLVSGLKGRLDLVANDLVLYHPKLPFPIVLNKQKIVGFKLAGGEYFTIGGVNAPNVYCKVLWQHEDWKFLCWEDKDIVEYTEGHSLKKKVNLSFKYYYSHSEVVYDVGSRRGLKGFLGKDYKEIKKQLKQLNLSYGRNKVAYLKEALNLKLSSNED